MITFIMCKAANFAAINNLICCFKFNTNEKIQILSYVGGLGCYDGMF